MTVGPYIVRGGEVPSWWDLHFDTILLVAWLAIIAFWLWVSCQDTKNGQRP